MFLTYTPLILASGSPRRRRFLEDLGLSFTTKTARVDEQVIPGEQARQYVQRLALEKARAVARHEPGFWVVGADTAVVLDGLILGKPSGPEEAELMLSSLSGRWHEVVTAFSLCREPKEGLLCQVVATEVLFAKNSPELIKAYVATGEPLDKAGAYGIQGKGVTLVREIRGSYSNVVGLPLAELVEALLKQGIIGLQ